MARKPQKRPPGRTPSPEGRVAIKLTVPPYVAKRLKASGNASAAVKALVDAEIKMTTRTGHVGDCYEYFPNGRRGTSTDQMTISDMVALSAREPYRNSYHVYRGTNGYVTWAHRGQEISTDELPQSLRDNQRSGA